MQSKAFKASLVVINAIKKNEMESVEKLTALLINIRNFKNDNHVDITAALVTVLPSVKP